MALSFEAIVVRNTPTFVVTFPGSGRRPVSYHSRSCPSIYLKLDSTISQSSLDPSMPLDFRKMSELPKCAGRSGVFPARPLFSPKKELGSGSGGLHPTSTQCPPPPTTTSNKTLEVTFVWQLLVKFITEKRPVDNSRDHKRPISVSATQENANETRLHSLVADHACHLAMPFLRPSKVRCNVQDCQVSSGRWRIPRDAEYPYMATVCLATTYCPACGIFRRANIQIIWMSICQPFSQPLYWYSTAVIRPLGKSQFSCWCTQVVLIMHPETSISRQQYLGTLKSASISSSGLFGSQTLTQRMDQPLSTYCKWRYCSDIPALT